MRLLLRFMKPYRALTAVTLLVLLVDNVGTLLVPTMLADMINTGIGTGDFDYIVSGGFAMLGASLLASGGAMTGAYLAAKLAANVARDIRNAVYDASLAFSSGDFEEFGTGSMITRTLNDTNVIQQSIIATIQLVLPVPFLAVAGIIMACMIDYQMGILLAFVVAIVLAIAVVTVTKAAPIFMSLQKLIDRMNVVLRESIVGARVIRAFNKERHSERRLDEVFTDYADRAIKVNLLFAGLDCSAFFFMNIAEVAVLWVGGNRVGAHAMQIASISAVLEYAMLILFFVMMAQIVALTLPRAGVPGSRRRGHRSRARDRRRRSALRRGRSRRRGGRRGGVRSRVVPLRRRRRGHPARPDLHVQARSDDRDHRADRLGQVDDREDAPAPA